MTDLPPRFVPGSTGLGTLQENCVNGMMHEWVVQYRLAGAGYEVTNLNIDAMDNFPVADLVASLSGSIQPESRTAASFDAHPCEM